MPTGKQYVVRVAFDRVDPKTGDSKRWEPGVTYSGEVADSYLTGVDDQGPLLVEKFSSATAASPVDSSSKES